MVKSGSNSRDFEHLDNFHEKVLYRTLEILRRNKEKIFSDILGSMFSVYDFEKKYLKLEIYREKDSIEKIFDSLKNETQIEPLRV